MPVYSSHLLSYAELTLGKRIREVRQQQGLTLRQLALRAGISAARLSQFENEEHTLDSRQALVIATALEVPIEALLPLERSVPFQVTREGEVQSRPPRESYISNLGGRRPTTNQFWPLAGLFVGRQMEPVLARILPTVDEAFHTSSHHSQEFAFVLKGAIEFAVETPRGRRIEELGPGDCIYFRASLPHRLRSLHPEPSETLHVFSADWSPRPTPLEWRAAAPGSSSPETSLAAELAFIRAAHGLSVKATAELLGLSTRQVRQIEDGKREIRFDTLMTFARAFGRPLRELLRNGPQPEPSYTVQRASEIDQIPLRERRHRLERAGTRGMFEHLPLARGFPARYVFPYLLRVPNVGIESLTTHEHHGQELIYVLDGQIELTSFIEEAESTETLRPGDSCYLDATVPHLVRGQSRNPYSQTSASIIVVFWCSLGEQYLFDLRDPSRVS